MESWRKASVGLAKAGEREQQGQSPRGKGTWPFGACSQFTGEEMRHLQGEVSRARSG